MTRDELWAVYVKRNPAFAGRGNVTLTKAGLHKLFDQTWDIARRDGAVTGRRDEPAPDVVGDLLKHFMNRP